MGYYINPKNESKETWLHSNGRLVTLVEVKDHQAKDNDELVVCLVDNGPFTAAGIAYDDEERNAFLYPDPRPKNWYMVKRELLREWCSII